MIEEVEEVSCCEAESTEKFYRVSYTAEESECCVSLVDSKKIDESFYPPIDKKEIVFELSAITSIDTEETRNQTSKLTSSIGNDLPPPMFGRELLQTIHQLKLDTSFC